ncbi:hypothetical protein C8R44DRAFT_889228 [Mycena epipterygia]|nr:hypothetical protein C8R44DRAFT_889228 [Mycena epipterygia]
MPTSSHAFNTLPPHTSPYPPHMLGLTIVIRRNKQFNTPIHTHMLALTIDTRHNRQLPTLNTLKRNGGCFHATPLATCLLVVTFPPVMMSLPTFLSAYFRCIGAGLESESIRHQILKETCADRVAAVLRFLRGLGGSCPSSESLLLLSSLYTYEKSVATWTRPRLRLDSTTMRGGRHSRFVLSCLGRGVLLRVIATILSRLLCGPLQSLPSIQPSIPTYTSPRLQSVTPPSSSNLLPRPPSNLLPRLQSSSASSITYLIVGAGVLFNPLASSAPIPTFIAGAGANLPSVPPSQNLFIEASICCGWPTSLEYRTGANLLSFDPPLPLTRSASSSSSGIFYSPSWIFARPLESHSASPRFICGAFFMRIGSANLLVGHCSLWVLVSRSGVNVSL